MCHFKSAIVMQDGRVLHSEFTDSHEDLIALYGIDDKRRSAEITKFVRVKFYPTNLIDLAEPEKYVLRLDENQAPAWWDDERKEAAAGELKAIIERMIVDDNREILVGGSYILTKNASVKRIVHCLIPVMFGKVGVMRKSSNIGEMLGSSNIGEMLGSSNVGVMRESSNIGEMWGSSKVGVMRESSNISVMRGSSNVSVMRESSNISVMRESSNVGEMRESL